MNVMQNRWSGLALLVLLLLVGTARGEEAESVVRWSFGAESTMKVTTKGEVRRDQPGPQAPEFPDFSKSNTAIKLMGNGARLVIADPGADSPYDFTNGDALTLEAWVKVDEINPGEYRYIIGKGRMGNTGFPGDNQNWALRIHEQGGLLRVNFLFASKPVAGEAGDKHWHRWSTKAGFAPQTGWHHVAVVYEFGKPETIRGWIDGTPGDGTWDMGGPTRRAPVLDDDEIWIGSSMKGAAGSSFQGSLDEIAIHRTRLSDKTLAARFNRLGGPFVIRPAQEVMPVLADIPRGRVLVTFSEGLPARDRWLNEGEHWPAETARWVTSEFLLPRIPLRYDDWGIRDSWKAPVLVRMAADVELSPGKYRILLRARALGRLWINGVVVARTKEVKYVPPNGEEPVGEPLTSSIPGLRAAGYHQQEVFGEAEVGTDGRCRVVFETVVGGKGIRTETGEVCVAVANAGSQAFTLLLPAESGLEPLPLTNERVDAAVARAESSLSKLDDDTRRQAAGSQDPFWEKRHATARAWAKAHPVAVPKLEGAAGQNPIDTFLAAKIQKSVAAAVGIDNAAAAQFHGQVLPILRNHCFRCHGDKEKGGLKLNTRAAALKGGDSEIPAIVPGQVEDSELLARVRSRELFDRMPPSGSRLSSDQVAILEKWIASGADWPAPPVKSADVAVAPMIDDSAFLRRVYLDTVGVPPTADEAKTFLADTDPEKRTRLIDRLLQDERCADQSMGYWQDMLAENPTLQNQSLNSTGPFRWYLYDSLRDHKPLDRMVTELLLLRGSKFEGGSAGFGQAAENDAPFAAKGQIVASAFLGIELQCARCHDSPYHSTLQRDLYSLSAMFTRAPVKVPASSNVPAAFFEKIGEREPLIRITLKPGEPITPDWPFAEVTGVSEGDEIAGLMYNPKDTRERLAALITAPQNRRFAQVMVNRVWRRLMGAGFVEPVQDWEGHAPSHPQLLDWLANELVASNYDLRHVVRLILNSQAWQREATGRNLAAAPELRFFNAPERRRLTAEQIVDSLHVATGVPMNVEELTFVHDGRRSFSSRLTLGCPDRAWMFAGLGNERDRPSLSLPRARTVADVLEAFGWNGSRQQVVTYRDQEANVLQPGVLANGTLSLSLTRAAYNSRLADLAVEAKSPESLVETLFLSFLSRYPTAEERATFVPALSQGFASRLVPADEVQPPEALPPLPLVTWFNHLRSEANTIQVEKERRTRLGPPSDPRLQDSWRQVYEDFAWSLVNFREFVWVP